MINNLVFTGLNKMRKEDTERLLKVFLQNELGISYHIEFCQSPRGKSPIVARFIYHKDLQDVLNNAYNFRYTPYGIRQQFPKEIEDRM